MSSTVDIEEGQGTPGLLPDGRPDPEYAAALGLVSAPLGRRAVAFLCDGAILVLLSVPAFIAAPTLVVSLWASALPGAPGVIGGAIMVFASGIAVIAAAIVQVALHGTKGLTLGKALLGIRSVNVYTLERPGFWRMVLRALVLYGCAIVVPVLGGVVMLASPLWNDLNRWRGWLDYVGRNWMVDSRLGMNPYNIKAIRQARRRLAKPDAGEEGGLPSLATGAGSPADGIRSPLFSPGSRSHSAIVGGPVPAAPHPAQPAIPGADLTPFTSAQAAVGAGRVTASIAAAPTVRYLLLFDDGKRYELAGSGVIGRNPEPRPGEDDGQRVAIEDSSMSISKTHAMFGVDADGFWISDRGSRNGTSVRSASGQITQIKAGERSYPGQDDVVFLGERSFAVKRER